MNNLICPACGYDGAFSAHGRYHETYYPKYQQAEDLELDEYENYTCEKCDYYGTAEEFEPNENDMAPSIIAINMSAE